MVSLKNKPHVFVAMPFDDSMDDIYHYAIENTVNDLGLICERTDKTIFMGNVLDRILGKISTAEVVIADITGGNPNVCLEVGYAQGKERPTILAIKGQEDPPINLRGHKLIRYNSIMELRRSLEKEFDNVKTHYEKNIEASYTDSKSGSQILVSISQGPEMDDIYFFGAKQTASKLELSCGCIDKATTPKEPQDKALEMIRSADLVITELTGSDPNVYFELGYAWAIDKPTVLITKDEKALAYDVRGRRCIIYSSIKNLSRQLSEVLEELKRQGIFGSSVPLEFEPNKLESYEGLWRDISRGKAAFARIVNGKLVIPYTWNERSQKIDAYYYDMRIVNGILLGQFKWLDNSYHGFAFYRLESSTKLVGGWWIGDYFPQELESGDISVLDNIIPEMTISALERDLSMPQFPEWVENFFKLATTRLGSDLWETTLKDSIIEASKRYLAHGKIYFDPEIPPKILINVREKCDLSSDESEWIVIDCTVFGSAKDCVVVTPRGIYSHNKNTKVFLPYKAFSKVAFGIDDGNPYVVVFSQPEGDQYIPLAGSNIKAQDFIKMLECMQMIIRDHDISPDV